MFTLGKMSVSSCLPVHSGPTFSPSALTALTMAGTGMRPSQFSSHMSVFINCTRVKNVSRLLNSDAANRESCTMLIMGLLSLGATIWRGTIIRF